MTPNSSEPNRVRVAGVGLVAVLDLLVDRQPARPAGRGVRSPLDVAREQLDPGQEAADPPHVVVAVAPDLVADPVQGQHPVLERFERLEALLERELRPFLVSARSLDGITPLGLNMMTSRFLRTPVVGEAQAREVEEERQGRRAEAQVAEEVASVDGSGPRHLSGSGKGRVEGVSFRWIGYPGNAVGVGSRGRSPSPRAGLPDRLGMPDGGSPEEAEAATISTRFELDRTAGSTRGNRDRHERIGERPSAELKPGERSSRPGAEGADRLLDHVMEELLDEGGVRLLARRRGSAASSPGSRRSGWARRTGAHTSRWRRLASPSLRTGTGRSASKSFQAEAEGVDHPVAGDARLGAGLQA